VPRGGDAVGAGPQVDTQVNCRDESLTNGVAHQVVQQLELPQRKGKRYARVPCLVPRGVQLE
jgi:hypothetical protein